MSSIADSILKGTYGKNSPPKSSIADMIIDGSYSERVRKQREEEEEKRRAERERQKKVSEVKTTTNVLPKANKRTWFQKGAFEDGYQFGDVTKTTVSTIGNVGANIWQGVHNTGAGIGRALAGGMAQVADWVGQDEFADKVRKNITEDTPLDKVVKANTEKTGKNSVLGDRSTQTIQGVGNYAGMAALQAVGVPWQVTSGMSALGSGLSEAYAEGASDAEAWISAGINAGVEIGSEYLFGGVKLPGTGKTTEAVIDGLTDKIKSKAVKEITKFGINAVGEGAEEVISGIGSALGKKLTYMSEKELNEIYSSEQALDDFITGTISSAIIGGAQQISAPKINNQNTQALQEQNTAPIEKTIEQSNVNDKETDSVSGTDNSMSHFGPESVSINNSISQNNKNVQEQIRIDCENFSKQVDAVKNGTFPKNDMLVLGNTPQVLKDIGLPDLPITMTQKHLDTIMNESGKYVGANYHNLGEDLVKQLPEAINNPLDVVKSNTKDDSVVLTTYLADKQNRTIIASIKIDGKGTVNDIRIDTNVMTSAYGRNNYEKFMQDNIKNGNLLYDIDRGVIKKVTGERLQLPIRSNFYTSGRLQLPTSGNTINNSITPQNENVNYINKYAQQAQNNTQNSNNVAPSVENNILPRANKQTMNPTEISNLKLEDANTTPQLTNKTYKTGNKQSSFLSNIITDSKFLNEDLRQQMGKEDNIRYYQGITNEKTLENAYNKLQKDGQSEVIRWHSKDSKNANAEDVAEGWILLKQYQDSGDYQSAVEVAKKMRDIGTTAGQTVQAYNILSRLTPEGMFYYAQSELNEAYNKMVEGKSKKWIEENQSKFDLTPEETQNILDIMKDVSTMEDGYDKKVKLAEVQKIITNKIPPTAGQSIKAWMRISMLFNPKTQVRNVMGNAVIVPVNMFSDSVSAGIDKLIARKTGVRTTGNINLKNYGKGFGKGLYESYNDFRKGINTRNIEGNRFEVSEGKNFRDKGIGKAVNRVDNILSFMLDAGDRGFYEATFVNSLNNQMVLNNVTTPTAEMIDIATNEALQKTWQDNNKYTQSVLKIRNILNNVNVKGYGLGDVIIPFAKTPANLTKAIVDYSPAGLVKTLTMDARKFKNSLQNGQYSPQLQHQFVQNLGKATAGTFLYVLSYGLAKAGIATGEADEDKDVKNFMKNSLGISSYSIKIGDKSFSYDWAQPIATPLAIMTNYVKYSEENPDVNIIEKGINAMNIGSEQLLQQSFMESLNTVLNGNGTTLENLSQAVLELPARAVPTFFKQIADMVDSTQRTTFEYNKPVQSAINSVIAKIPLASRTLPASVDTLGNEIKKYGGNNNVWNVMFNPANTNKGALSKAGQEIYNVYKETGDTTIFPRTAPYYINSKGEKITMTSEQRSKFQTVSGQYVESSLKALLNDQDYKKLSNEEKVNIINEIVSDSYSKAKYDVLRIDSKEYEKLRTTLKDIKPSTYYNYKFKTEDMKKDSEKIDVLINSRYTNKEKTALYEKYILSSADKQYPIIKETFTENGLNITKYLKYKNQDFSADKKDDGTIKGASIYGSGKQKRKEYIESMGITYTQGAILYGLECSPSDSDKRQIVNYIKTLPNKTNKEKIEMLSRFEWITIYKDGSYTY